jgi:hypothetical protein
VHGLIFFYIQKFADSLSGSMGRETVRSTISAAPRKYLPSGVYPDQEAVGLIDALATATGEPLPTVVERFGEFLAGHLMRVAGGVVDPSWRTLDVIERTEEVIHAMIRSTNPGAKPPVIECVRTAVDEVSVVYASPRRLCGLAAGIMRGLADHFGETITLEQTSCMNRGDPFCTFAVRLVTSESAEGEPRPPSLHDTVGPAVHPADPHLSHTTVLGETGEAGSQGAAVAPGPLPGQVGGYRVLGLLGEGGMGRVYHAHDDRLSRSVAIKVMLPGRARDEAARRRFLRESQAAAAVEHENVVAIHQVGEHEGLPYLVMQRLVGTTLAAHRERLGRLSTAEGLRIGREIAAGLAAAHDRGLVHRDIKPDNIWLEGGERRVKIIDFGLARDTGDGRQLTLEGAILGTPSYMAPERIAEETVDASGDVFGLGVILYELLAGRLPFEGRSLVAILAAISRGHPTPLAEAAPDVPEEVSRLVMRLLAQARSDRPSAREVVEAIRAIERGLPA